MLKILMIDMDGVLANFRKGVGRPVGANGRYESDPPEMFVPGFFRGLEVMPGAKEAVQQLLASKRYKIYIASKPTTKNDFCVSEKMGWLREHFPDLIRNVIFTTNKNLLIGDYLIDDDKRWKKFNGEFIHFNEERPAESWQMVIEKLDNEPFRREEHLSSKCL